MITNSLLTEYLVATVSDDYENMDFLRNQISQWPPEYREVFSAESLLAAICEALEDGLINSYKFNPTSSLFEKCSFRAEAAGDYWFLKSGALGFPHNL